jgi:ketosteroid isomerase-like protein
MSAVEMNLETIRRIYGVNWASVAGQDQGLAGVTELVAPSFTYNLDPAIGRSLHDISDIRVFLQAIEEDFRDLSLTPEEFEPVGEDHVVVVGTVHGQGRLSGIPFSSPFSHLWRLEDGRAVRLDGFLDPQKARDAAAAVARG